MSLATGTSRLMRLHVRTTWRSLLLWPLVMGGLVAGVARSITVLYPTPQDRLTYAATSGASPASVAFNGRWTDLTTLGGITTNEVGFMGLLLFPTVATLLAIRHTRGEEDAGRTELLTAARVGRLAPLLAAVLVITMDLLLFGAISAAGSLAAGLPVTGSIRYAVSLVLFALTFASLGLLVGEASRESRTATGVGLGIVLGLFLARAVIDGAGWSLTWATPAGWLTEVRPFGGEESAWWPYAAYLTAIVILLGAAAMVALRRDLYGGVFAARPGPAVATARLTTPTGLVWRLTRGAFLGWLLGLLVWGGALGAISDTMTAVIRASPQLLELFGVERAEDIVTGLSLSLAAIGSAALFAQGVGRLAGEEDSGRLGFLAAGRHPRRRLWMSWAVVLVLESIALIMAQATALGLATTWATGDSANIREALAGGAVTVPAVLLIGTGALLVRAVAPPVAAAVWVLVGWVAIVAFLADALDLPTWARRLSPLDAVGRVPMDDPRLWVIAGFTVVAAILALVSTAGFARRDLRAG